MTNGAGSPANTEVFFRAIPARTMTAILRKYIAGAINTESGKKAEIAPASETLMTELLGKCGYFHEGGNTAWYRADDTEKNAPLTFKSCF